jgi:hypothetical protein
MSDQIESLNLSVPDTELADLRERLEHTRWPERETVPDTGQGPKLAKLQALTARWLDGYDWRKCEEELNAFGQFRTAIDIGSLKLSTVMATTTLPPLRDDPASPRGGSTASPQPSS